MAQQLVTDEGELVIPGGYASYKVQQDVSGLSTTGVLMLVGEADKGPHHSDEDDLALNAFGPNSAAAVLAKYGSGPLVDAYRAAAVPSADNNILGAPARIVLAKTNAGAKARLTLEATDASDYAILADRSYGKSGNLIYTSIEADVAEVIPTTSSFTFIPAVGTVAYGLRVNGAASVGGTLSAATTPAAFVTALNLLTGVAATGGTNRAAHPASGTLALAAPGSNVITLTASTTFATTPTVGDTLTIPDGSVVEGGSNANVGCYVITAATSTVITATKLSDAGKPSATAGTITAPAAVSAASVVGAADMVVHAPITITLASSSAVIDGVGKSLEIAELTTGTDLLSRTAFGLGTTTAVTWVSKVSSAKLLTSAS